MLSPSCSSPRSQNTLAHFQARSPMVHSHFAFSCAQLATLPGALRGRAWRLESGEIEGEEEAEEVEEDVCDEERKKI